MAGPSVELLQRIPLFAGLEPRELEREIKKRFPKGFKALRPYLRMTPQPNR